MKKTFCFILVCSLIASYAFGQNGNPFRLSIDVGIDHNSIFKNPILPLAIPNPCYQCDEDRPFPTSGFEVGVNYDHILKNRFDLRLGFLITTYNYDVRRSIEIARLYQPLVTDPETKEYTSFYVYSIPALLSYRIQHFEVFGGIKMFFARKFRDQQFDDSGSNIVTDNQPLQYGVGETLTFYLSYRIPFKRINPLFNFGFDYYNLNDTYYFLSLNIPIIDNLKYK